MFILPSNGSFKNMNLDVQSYINSIISIIIVSRWFPFYYWEQTYLNNINGIVKAITDHLAVRSLRT